MSALMDYLEFFRVYIDYFLITLLGSFEDHLANVEEVMNQLQPSGIKCKNDKCKLALPKVEYLGYIIKQEGSKLDPKKSK